MVNEIMRGVNHSQYGKVLHLLGASPLGVRFVTFFSGTSSSSTTRAARLRGIRTSPASLGG
eukprot:694679-Prymnesium_polylepis.1